MAMRAISVFSEAQCDSTRSRSMQEVRPVLFSLLGLGQTLAGGERGPVLLVSGSSWFSSAFGVAGHGSCVIINSQESFSCQLVLLK